MNFIQLMQYGGFVAAQVINALLLYLLYTRAGSSFGRYRILMIAFSYYAMVYSLIEVVTLPIMVTKGHSLCVCSDGPLKLNRPIGVPLTSLYCGCFGMCISLLTLHFFYRYIAVCKPDKLYYFDGKRIIITFLPCFGVWIVWTLTVLLFMSPVPEKEEHYFDVLLKHFNTNSYEAAFLSFLYRTQDTENGPGHWNLLDLMASAILSCIMSSCFSTIMFCGLKALRQMKNCGEHMSAKTKELNRQLFITLGMQTLLPFITMYAPVGSVIVLPVFGIELGVAANKVGAFLGLYPALDALIAIILIRDFRNFVFCKKKFGKNIVSGIHSTTTGIQSKMEKSVTKT